MHETRTLSTKTKLDFWATNVPMNGGELILFCVFLNAGLVLAWLASWMGLAAFLLGSWASWQAVWFGLPIFCEMIKSNAQRNFAISCCIWACLRTDHQNDMFEQETNGGYTLSNTKSICWFSCCCKQQNSWVFPPTKLPRWANPSSRTLLFVDAPKEQAQETWSTMVGFLTTPNPIIGRYAIWRFHLMA